MRFDDVLEEIGGFGAYQKFVFALTCGPNLLAGFFMLNPVFLLGVPNHRCTIPGYEGNDTYAIQDDFHQCLVNLTIPRTTKADHDYYDRCRVYKIEDAISICKTGIPSDLNDVDNSSTSKCQSWIYDKTVFTSTFVSEHDLVCDKDIWVANAEMLLYAGMLVGSLLSGILSDIYGRKPVLYVSILVMVGSSIWLAFVKHFSTFCVAQFILGAAVIACFMPAYVISLEITSAKKRVWPGVISDFPYVFGLILYAAIAYGLRDWMKIQLYTALPGLLFLSYWWLMPESPRWLLTKGRVKEAEAVIQRAAKWNKVKLSKRNLSKTSVDDDDKDSASFFRLFSSKTMCFRTLVIFFNWTVVAFAYFGLALNTENLAGNLYLNFGISGIVELPAYILVILLVDKIGRRRLYCLTMLIGGLSCISTILALKYGPGDTENGALTVTLAMIGKLLVTAGYSVQYIHSAELFPTVVRNAGLGGASLFARAGTMIAPYIVVLGEEIGGSAGEAFPLIVFGGMSFLSGLVSLVLPETLNRHLPETMEDGERFGKSGAFYFVRSLKLHDSEEGTSGEKVSLVPESSSEYERN